MTFDAKKYKEISKKMSDMKMKLHEMEQEKSDMEQEILKGMKIGDFKEIDGVHFEVKEGRRGLYPKENWQEEWESFINGLGLTKPELNLANRIIVPVPATTKITTLAEVEKIMNSLPVMEEHREKIKNILGFRDGSRSEKVSIKD